jgi:hypothetical protein
MFTTLNRREAFGSGPFHYKENMCKLFALGHQKQIFLFLSKEPLLEDFNHEIL